MKAAILVAQNQPLELEQLNLPESLDYGQVLVEVHYSSICGSQLGEISGVKGPDRFLPHLLGHEGGGIVRQAGPSVSTVNPGDHVVLHWRKGTGIEARPPKYRWQDKEVNAGWVTTFNDHAVVSENRLTVIPETVDLRLAPLLGCALTTGVGVITRDAQLRLGESVAIFGVGGVGLASVQAAALSGAYPVIAIDIHPQRLELARKLGATHCINSQRDIALDEIRRIVGAAGCDVCVDNTGVPGVMREAFEATGPKGRFILVGVPRVGEELSLHTLPLHFGKQIKGSHGGDAEPEEDIPRLLRLVEAGKLDLESMITDSLPLSEVNSAIELLRSGSVAGRCLLTM